MIHIEKKKFRYVLALILAIFFAMYGVFIYSDFIYRGLSLDDNIFPLIFSGSYNYFWDGIFQLIGSGFQADWFSSFSIKNINEESIIAIIFSETIWAAILTWFTSGLIIGILLNNLKKGILNSILVFGIMLFIWIISGLFAGADLTTMIFTNFTNTLGELFTGFIFIILGSIAGSFLGGLEY